MNQHHFYYQPSPIFSTIDWCWTFIVLLTGIIFWLEVTHVQWITICFFIAFFIIAGTELSNRQLIIKGSTLIVQDVFRRSWRQFNLKTNEISFTKHTIIISKPDHKYQYSLLNNELNELRNVVHSIKR